MKNLTINEFMELAKGKRWDVCTIGTCDALLDVVFSGARVSLSLNNQAIGMTIAKDGFRARFANRLDQISAIEQHNGYVFMRLHNLPAMIFTESTTIEKIQTEAPA